MYFFAFNFKQNKFLIGEVRHSWELTDLSIIVILLNNHQFIINDIGYSRKVLSDVFIDSDIVFALILRNIFQLIHNIVTNPC